MFSQRLCLRYQLIVSDTDQRKPSKEATQCCCTNTNTIVVVCVSVSDVFLWVEEGISVQSSIITFAS